MEDHFRHAHLFLWIGLNHHTRCRVHSGAHLFFYYASSFSTEASGIRHQHGSGSDAAHPGQRSNFCAGCHVNSQRKQCHFLRTAPYFCVREVCVSTLPIMRQHTAACTRWSNNSFSRSTRRSLLRSRFSRTIDKNRLFIVRSQQMSALRYTQSCQQLIHGKRLVR